MSIGFSGLRMDAAKHIKPESISAIFAKFKANMGGNIPDDFVAWLEVLLGGEKDLLMCNAGSGYNYGMGFVNAMKAAGLSDADIYKIKIW
jgi:alpha-amylase